jgi:hypothetical protein
MHRRDRCASQLRAQHECDSTLWTTKYFPSTLSEVPLFKKSQVENFVRIVDQAFCGPPMHARVILITGPVGCGKSTLVRAVCKAQRIGIVAFSPDDQWDLPDDSSESLSVAALRTFLTRAQLVTDPGQRQIVLLDDLAIAKPDLPEFVEILAAYGCARGRAFPLVWIPDADAESAAPPNAVIFRFPAASHTVLTRVLRRVSAAEALNLDRTQIERLIADNPGDVRLAVNQLQFSGGFTTGTYEALGFFRRSGRSCITKGGCRRSRSWRNRTARRAR